MNNDDDYIVSGVLELYAAGALREEEQLAVEHMAAHSPEIQTALEEACAVMEHYAALHAVQPAPSLRVKVIQKIEQIP